MSTASTRRWAMRELFAVALLLGTSLSGVAAEQAVATVASSANLDAAPVLFIASFFAPGWSGRIIAERPTPAGTATPMWDAAKEVDSLPDALITAQRFVLTSDSAGTGTSFQWSAMTPASRALFATYGLDEGKIDYLRGDRRKEAGKAGGTLRTRASRLGDIVNANAWYVGPRLPQAPGAAVRPNTPTRPAMVFTGANDGMLHGFSADDGVEKLAYIPRGVQPKLALLADPAYQHQYYVDGPVFSGDAAVSGGPPRTFLVGALGNGGNGFFVLDVTDPAQFGASNPATIFHVDRTGDNDPDIGQISAAPVVDAAAPNRSRQIVQMNNGRWAAVMGNGYFSANASPVLLIQYLDDINRDKTTGARELVKLSPCMATPACPYKGSNGLAAPQLIDVNGDGQVDLAYAGDLQGNVWKFDLSTSNTVTDPATAWKVSFDNKPFFIARGADGKRQAITTAPHWMPHPRGGIMIAVGTGRNLDDTDRNIKRTDTIYGLYDDSAIVVEGGIVRIQDTTPIHTAEDTTPRSAALVHQSYADSFTDAGIEYRNSTTRPVDYVGPGRKRGWLIDLPLPGQRVLHNPRSLEGQRMLVQSTLPLPGTPAPGTTDVIARTSGASTISILNMLTGQPPAQSVFMLSDAQAAPKGLSMMNVPSGPLWQFRQAGQTRLTASGHESILLRSVAPAGMRAGWREIQ